MITYTFDERFGRIPCSLASLIKRAKVTPAEFYAMEYQNMSHADMEAYVKSHMVDGRYAAPLFF